MTELLKVEQLVTRLRNGARIVDDISFSIQQGETFALLGESGCGKSMTALSLMRLLPDSIRVEGGKVQLADVDLLSLPERDMRAVRGGKMAMIFQEPGLSLNPVMTVGEQIAEALELHHDLRGAAVQARCIELLDQVGIPDAARRLHEYPFQLSGGMKQRVMIAMALAGQPKLLVADEPTTALDVTIQAQIIELLSRLQEQLGMAILLITHNLGIVGDIADDVAVMYAGQIVETAPAGELLKRPLHPYTQALMNSVPSLDSEVQRLTAIPGAVPRLGAFPAGCRFHPRCARAQAECSQKQPVLVEVEPRRWVRCPFWNATGLNINPGTARQQDPSQVLGQALRSGGRGER